MNRPSVGHVTTVASSLRYLLLDQLVFLRRAGFEVAGISSPGEDAKALETARVPHLPVPLRRSSRLTPLADLHALVRLWLLFRRRRFLIVHTHTAKPDLYAAIAARLAGVPIVITTLHGFFFHDRMPPVWRRFYIFLARLGGRFTDLVLSQNPEDLDTAAAERVYPRSKIEFLGNGIDLERFDPRRVDRDAASLARQELGLDPDSKIIGFVGRLVRDKGVLELLQAARLVRQQEPAIRLLLVGPMDPAKQDAVSPRIARDVGVEDICHFTGQRQDMPVLYALMDVFVLPSYREAFPRSLMEASAMEVPCVATDVRGCRTAVEDGRNGRLVPLGDITALAAALLDLLRDPELARSIGREGRSVAEERFDQRKVFATVAGTYRRLLAAKGLPLPAGEGGR